MVKLNENVDIKKVLSGSLGTFLLLIILMAIFALSSPNFMTISNLQNVLIQSGTNAIISVGMTYVIISGNTDLSVGSILALSSCIGATVMVGIENVILGIIVSLVAGLILGMLNGFLIGYLKFQPFIVTLSTMWLYRGLAYLFTGGQAVTGLPESMSQIAVGSILYIPNIVWIMAIVYIVAYIVLNKTTMGRKLCAVGDNSESARLSGINVKRVTLATFTFSGFCAALSGIVYMARLNSGQPIAGQSYEMYAIAAAVIGGASFTKGGIGSIPGTLVGAIFIAVLNNGLTILNVNTYWQQVLMGIVVLLAVALDQVRKKVR